MGVTVVYENMDGDTVWVFWPDGRCRSFEGIATRAKVPELKKETTVYIHDSKAKQKSTRIEPAGDIKAALAIFSSANSSVMKQTERGKILSLGFPTPTLKEAQVANKTFGNNAPKYSEQQLRHLVGIGGTHFRNLFDKEDEEILRTNIINNIGHIKLDAIDAVISAVVSFDSGIRSGDTAPSSSFSTALSPALEEEFYNSDFDLSSPFEKERRMQLIFNLYKAHNLEWGLSSPFILEQIILKAKNSGENFTAMLLKAMVKHPALSSNVAGMLELHAPNLLSAGGDFQCRDLNIGGTSNKFQQADETCKIPKTTLVNVENMVTNLQRVVFSIVCVGTSKPLMHWCVQLRRGGR